MRGRSDSEVQIFVDFDGTITSRDSIVYLTEKWGGGPDFRGRIRRQIQAGEISVFQAIEQELATVRIGWEEAARDLEENIFVDPEFAPFVEWCRREGYPIQVVSSGIEQVVSHFIGHMEIPFVAHPVQITEQGWFYQRDPEADKMEILKRNPRERPIVYIGDGNSDVAAVPYVDILFAKNDLARHCERHSIPFRGYENFRDVRTGLEALLSA